LISLEKKNKRKRTRTKTKASLHDGMQKIDENEEEHKKSASLINAGH
jgi:hypothetical protein